MSVILIRKEQIENYRSLSHDLLDRHI